MFSETNSLLRHTNKNFFFMNRTIERRKRYKVKGRIKNISVENKLCGGKFLPRTLNRTLQFLPPFLITLISLFLISAHCFQDKIERTAFSVLIRNKEQFVTYAYFSVTFGCPVRIRKYPYPLNITPIPI